MDCAVIRICYQDDISGTHVRNGWHGSAEPSGHGATTVYLLPGLTGEQRQAVLRRLRQEASRGCGPALPLDQLLLALCIDRVRTALRVTASVTRLHPLQTLLLSTGTVVLITLFVLASAEAGGVGPAMRPALAGMVTSTGTQPASQLQPRVSTVLPIAAWVAVSPGAWASRSGRSTGSSGSTGLGLGLLPGAGATATAQGYPRVQGACFGALAGDVPAGPAGGAGGTQLACLRLG